jgi:hypothetical protein
MACHDPLSHINQAAIRLAADSIDSVLLPEFVDKSVQPHFVLPDIVVIQGDGRTEIFSIDNAEDAVRSLPNHEIRAGAVSLWPRDLGRPAGLLQNAFGKQAPEIFGRVMGDHAVLDHGRRHLIQQ